jgi:hypothetical protein
MTPSEALAIACRRACESCANTAERLEVWARRMRRHRVVCYFATILFGALAMWNIFDSERTMAAVCTFFASTIPLAYRATDGDRAIDRFTWASGEFANLADRFRIAAEVDGQRTFAEFKTTVLQLLERTEKLRLEFGASARWHSRNP